MPSGIATVEYPVAGALSLVALSLVHLAGTHWQFAERERRRLWLSIGGGATVAYVFVLLLPEVSEAALEVGATAGEALLAEQRVYLVALLGFVVFYGVEVFATQQLGEETAVSSLVFWIHTAIFALYSAVIGYLLFHQEATTVSNLLFYALAMALHFSITDHGLRRHHGPEFDRVGRWLLALATLFGGVVGILTEIDTLALSMLFGFIAGAVILNVLKEELPALDQTRFAAFAAGATAYTVIILLT